MLGLRGRPFGWVVKLAGGEQERWERWRGFLAYHCCEMMIYRDCRAVTVKRSVVGDAGELW